MTNGTIMSRRACVEKIRINPDGSIDEVEMTSLGFEDSLNPYCETSADIACVLIGSAFVTERNVFSRPVVNIKDGDVIGYKYFDFGQDFSSKTMDFCAKIRGSGSLAKVKILLDSPDNGEEIGELDIGPDDTFITSKVKAVQGRHSVYFKVRHNYGGFFLNMFEGRELFQLESFFFSK